MLWKRWSKSFISTVGKLAGGWQQRQEKKKINQNKKKNQNKQTKTFLNSNRQSYQRWRVSDRGWLHDFKRRKFSSVIKKKKKLKRKIEAYACLGFPNSVFKRHEIMEMKRRQCSADEHNFCNADLLSECTGMWLLRCMFHKDWFGRNENKQKTL